MNNWLYYLLPYLYFLPWVVQRRHKIRWHLFLEITSEMGIFTWEGIWPYCFTSWFLLSHSPWGRSFQARGIFLQALGTSVPGVLLLTNTMIRKLKTVSWNLGLILTFLSKNLILLEKRSLKFWLPCDSKNSVLVPSLDSCWDTVNVKKAYILFPCRKSCRVGFSRGKEIKELTKAGLMNNCTTWKFWMCLIS